jgi:hypothetical protein
VTAGSRSGAACLRTHIVIRSAAFVGFKLNLLHPGQLDVDLNPSGEIMKVSKLCRSFGPPTRGGC